MTTFGRISEFDPAVDDWLAYAERLEQYLAANDITEADRKRAILHCEVFEKDNATFSHTYRMSYSVC